MCDRQARLGVFLVAGEESGDQLGAKLMAALRRRLGEGGVSFAGVGGAHMAAEGLASLFPLADIAVMGFAAVLARLPALLRRIRATVEAIVAAPPDVLVIIDSPGFTHAVASRVRARLPSLPIVNYVSPSVWAWRPGRAPRMRAYVDHVLALLPFEPAAHERLGGPACTYVGHPLIERLAELRPSPGERVPLGNKSPVLLVLPGSRPAEIRRLMAPFGEALGLVRARHGPFRLVLPAVVHLAEEIAGRAASWPLAPEIIISEAAKLAAFRAAHAALAASGTVTLELALAGVPMAVAYKIARIEEPLRHFIRVPSIVLPNLILGDNAVPEFLQWNCTPEKLATALVPLLSDTPTRRAQMEAFARLDTAMSVGPERPSERAARLIVDMMAGQRGGAAAGCDAPAAAADGRASRAPALRDRGGRAQ